MISSAPNSDSFLSAEYWMDRRKLKKKLTLWRMLTIFLAVVFCLSYLAYFFPMANVPARSPHIARVQIQGALTGDEATLELLKQVEESGAKGIILELDSPGGTTAGSEILYTEIRRLAQKLPLVALIGHAAASGGYAVALGSDYIIARGNSIVGSIGVVGRFPNAGSLFDKIGVKIEEVKTSPLKASPNGFEPLTPETKAALEGLIQDSYHWFTALVQERRALSETELQKVIDGRLFTARQGLSLKLIDAIGGRPEALAWLAKHKVEESLPVRLWKKRSSSFLFDMTSVAGRMMHYVTSALFKGGLQNLTQESNQPLTGLISIADL